MLLTFFLIYIENMFSMMVIFLCNFCIGFVFYYLKCRDSIFKGEQPNAEISAKFEGPILPRRQPAG